LNVGFQIKDVFTDIETFLRPNSLALYSEIDSQLIFQVLGYDLEKKNDMILG
jgi:hypothetical protein